MLESNRSEKRTSLWGLYEITLDFEDMLINYIVQKECSYCDITSNEIIPTHNKNKRIIR